MKEALSSIETSVLIVATWYNVPEDPILHSGQLRMSAASMLQE
jgi:hypothetical protein